MRPKVSPCLWFDGEAELAAAFYVGIFANARIVTTTRSGGSDSEGGVLAVAFELDGQPFTALNGGPGFAFTPAIPLIVDCTTQDEVDRYWAMLGEGGTPQRCGWLTDRFGVSWQIVPRRLVELLQDPDAERAGRVMTAMLAMRKIDIRALEAAAG